MNSKYLAKHIGFPLQDKMKGTNILETLEFLRKSQFWDSEKIHDYQLMKLKTLVDYAKNNVPYYEDLFKNLKLCSRDINSLNDIEKIPILTKKILQEQGDRLISREFSKFNVKKGKTGGTTGVPSIVYKDSNNRSYTWASYYRWYEWMNINYYDSVTTLWGAPTVLFKHPGALIYAKLKHSIQNNINFNSFELTDEKMRLIHASLLKNKPVLFKGYLSSLLDFAKYIEANNFQVPKLKAISTTTETLFQHNRIYLERVFKAPIFDQYGCGEVSAISYECSKHNGLHINQEHVVCEVLDDYSMSIVEKTGRVIVTDLDNYVMPFIRYENGDLAKLSSSSCSCGVNQPLMLSIEGRSSETIILNNGNKVHGVFITDILYELEIMSNTVRKFQVNQSIPGEIVLRLECKMKLKKEKKRILIDTLSRFFVKVVIDETNYIKPSKNGKYRYVVSEILQ